MNFTWYDCIILIILLCLVCTTYGSQQDDAIDAALRAGYEQTGMKSDIENYGKKLEKIYIPKDQEKLWGEIFYLADAVYRCEIKVKFTF